MDKVNIKEILKNWKKRGFSCYTWVNSPAQRWEESIHTTDEVVIVIEGKMESYQRMEKHPQGY